MKNISVKIGTRPDNVISVFNKNIGRFFQDFKKQFQEFLDRQIYMEDWEGVRQCQKKLDHMFWWSHIMDMYDNDCKLMKEFLKQYQKKQFFGDEVGIVRYYEKSDDSELCKTVLRELTSIFAKTNSSKYTNAQEWYKSTAQCLVTEFAKYPYIAWEMLVISLQEEKPTEFPCLNDMLKRLDKIFLHTNQIKFLKKINVL